MIWVKYDFIWIYKENQIYTENQIYKESLKQDYKDKIIKYFKLSFEIKYLQYTFTYYITI